MNLKHLIFLTALFVFSHGVFSQNDPFIKVKKGAPNILWITSDQQRWNTLGVYGNPYVKTPNLDRLANEGVMFNYAFSQSPICTPSRASFLTGMYPSTIHASKNGAADWAEAAPLISKMLADAGYDGGLVGKYHLSTAMAHKPEKRPKDDGYRVFWYSHSPYQGGSSNDYISWFKQRGTDIIALKNEYDYVPSKYHMTKWATDRAIDFMNERRENPWFLSLNLYDPHVPLDPPQEYLDRYDIDKLPEPWVNDDDIKEKQKLNDILFQSRPKKYSPHENKLKLAQYLAQIDLIDENVGRLIDALKESDQLDNTLIIFTSDHGDMMGDHGLYKKGNRFYEGLVRVPLIFWYPGHFKEDLKSDALVELIDITPTLLELTGLAIPERIQGKSLLNLLKGKQDPNVHREFVRSEFYDALMPKTEKGEENSFGTMLRTRRYKIVNYMDYDEGELFDLQKDPEEYHNLWNDPDYADVRFRVMKMNFNETIRAIDTGPERLGRY